MMSSAGNLRGTYNHRPKYSNTNSTATRADDGAIRLTYPAIFNAAISARPYILDSFQPSKMVLFGANLKQHKTFTNVGCQIASLKLAHSHPQQVARV